MIEGEPGINRIGETPVFDEPVWWGVTVGSLAYIVKGRNSDEVLSQVADSLDRTVEGMVIVPTFVHPHDETFQEELNTRYSDRTLIRHIPGSMEEWPLEIEHATAAQAEALDRLRS